METSLVPPPGVLKLVAHDVRWNLLQLGQHFDAIVTACDRVLETCPTWPDDPERIHWSILDPATVQGTEAQRLWAFKQLSMQLTTRLRLFLTLVKKEKRSTHES